MPLDVQNSRWVVSPVCVLDVIIVYLHQNHCMVTRVNTSTTMQRIHLNSVGYSCTECWVLLYWVYSCRVLLYWGQGTAVLSAEYSCTKCLVRLYWVLSTGASVLGPGYCCTNNKVLLYWVLGIQVLSAECFCTGARVLLYWVLSTPVLSAGYSCTESWVLLYWVPGTAVLRAGYPCTETNWVWVLVYWLEYSCTPVRGSKWSVCVSWENCCDLYVRVFVCVSSSSFHSI